MAKIHVTPVGDDVYRVRVKEENGSSEHQVTATVAHLEAYGAGADSKTVIEESFRFLLEREPKESILSRFELPVIERYFPEYPQEIHRRLA